MCYLHYMHFSFFKLLGTWVCMQLWKRNYFLNLDITLHVPVVSLIKLFQLE